MNFTALLQKHKLRATQPRLQILSTMHTSSEPMSMDVLQAKLHDQLDTSTLYRSLKKLVKHGLVYQTHFRDGKTYYEYQNHHHHHIVCTDCGVKEAVSLCVADQYATILDTTKKFAHVDDHMLEFFGLCRTCSSE
jgi:Fur family ferric uptake transcriptional regulator